MPLVLLLLVAVFPAVAWAGDEPSSDDWQTGRKILDDHKQFYSWDTGRRLLIGLGAAGVLANTSADENFQSWYQESVRNDTTDDLARAFKTFGEGKYVVPVSLGAYLWARLGHRPHSGFGRWGERTLRGFVVGAPPLVVLQRVTGASRPDEGGSEWQPFEDENGASGHAFVGSLPFLAGARMSRNRAARATLYFASTLAAWSRINDNRHYLSQAALGWWIGYLSIRSVDRTERKRAEVSPVPVAGGLGIVVTIPLGRAGWRSGEGTSRSSPRIAGSRRRTG